MPSDVDGEFLLIGSIYREPTVYIYIQKTLGWWIYVYI